MLWLFFGPCACVKATRKESLLISASLDFSNTRGVLKLGFQRSADHGEVSVYLLQVPHTAATPRTLASPLRNEFAPVTSIGISRIIKRHERGRGFAHVHMPHETLPSANISSVNSPSQSAILSPPSRYILLRHRLRTSLCTMIVLNLARRWSL